MNRFSLARAMENHFRAVKANYLAILVVCCRHKQEATYSQGWPCTIASVNISSLYVALPPE